MILLPGGPKRSWLELFAKILDEWNSFKQRPTQSADGVTNQKEGFVLKKNDENHVR